MAWEAESVLSHYEAKAPRAIKSGKEPQKTKPPMAEEGCRQPLFALIILEAFPNVPKAETHSNQNAALCQLQGNKFYSKEVPVNNGAVQTEITQIYLKESWNSTILTF